MNIKKYENHMGIMQVSKRIYIYIFLILMILLILLAKVIKNGINALALFSFYALIETYKNY